MVMTEAEVTGAIHGNNEVALETEVIQGFHANEPIGVQVAQLSESGAADVPDKMIEAFGDRERVLLRARQEIEIVEDGQFEVAQVIIGRAAAAQPQPKEQQSPPAEKTSGIRDQGLITRVGQLVLPLAGLRKKVADSFEEGSRQGYDLPRLRRWAVTWVWMSARASCVSSRVSCLRRRCS
jgi:hypothetical protein